jgi:hypothetical protein
MAEPLYYRGCLKIENKKSAKNIKKVVFIEHLYKTQQDNNNTNYNYYYNKRFKKRKQERSSAIYISRAENTN